MKTLLRSTAFLLIALLPPVSEGADGRDDGWKDIGQPIVVATHVDAQGQVTQVELVVPATLPQVEALTVQTVKRLRFIPARLNGIPTNALTYVKLQARSHQDAGQVSLKLRYVSHGPGRTRRVIPRYPADMIHDGIQAELVVDATVSEDGIYTDVHVLSASTTGGHDGKSFYTAVSQALAQTHILPEQVDGHPVATHTRIPFNFNLVGNGRYISQDFENAPDLPRYSSPDHTIVRGALADDPVALDSPLQLTMTPP